MPGEAGEESEGEGGSKNLLSNSPEDRLELNFDVHRTIESEGGNDSQSECTDDVDLLVPVLESDGRKRALFCEYFSNIVVVRNFVDGGGFTLGI